MTKTPKFKKVSVEIKKLEAGDTLVGVYADRTEGPWIDRTTGEEKTLTRLFFDTDEGRVIIFEDAGLKNCMLNANVKIGDLIKLEKGEKKSMPGGRTVNSYEIYIAQH